VYLSGMKHILIVSDKFTNGGLETHIRGEIIQLQRYGWNVHVVFSEVSSDLSMPTGIKSIATGIKMDASTTAAEMVESVDDIITIVRHHRIKLLHAHGFFSLIPSMMVAQAEKIPLVITLHGPVFFQYFYNQAHRDIINSMVLPEASLIVVVSEEIRELARVHVDDKKIVVLPNAVNFGMAASSQASDPRFLVVSRLDADKIDGIVDFVEKARDSGICGLLIAGCGNRQEALEEILSEKELTGFVEFLGFCENISDLMRNCAGVAGMGRVVLEALALKKTIVLIGYDGVKGVVDCGLLKCAQRENFSGRGLSTITAQDLHAQLHAISVDELHRLYMLAKSHFDERYIWSVFSQITSGLESVKKNDLHDIYGAIKNNFFESRVVTDPYCIQSLKIQVAAEKEQVAAIARQRDAALEEKAVLQTQAQEKGALLTRQRDAALEEKATLQTQTQEIEALLIRQRDAALEANTALQEQMQEKETLLIGQRDALAEKNRLLRTNIDAILSSTSWKMTRPFRYLEKEIERWKNRLG